MISLARLVGIVVCPAISQAEPLPAGGADLIDPAGKITAWSGKGGHAETVDTSVGKATRITVTQPDPDQPWTAQLRVPATIGAVKSGDKLLVSYSARCIAGGSGQAIAKLQLSDSSNAMIGVTESAKFSAEWEPVNQPFLARVDAPAGSAEFVMFFGEKSQTVEIANIRVLNYGPAIDLSQLPRQRQSYPGREPDAPWRTAALARIAKLRQADLACQLTGVDGKPLANTAVTVELARHEFGFGSCVTRGMLTKEGPDGARYRDIARRTFSCVVFENDLKPDTFPHDAQGRAELEKSFAWLKAQGISIRGHYLMQEAVDGWSRERLGDPGKLKADLLASVRERIVFAGDRVTEWDVINHPVAWQGADLYGQKGPPLATLGMEVFREARALTKLPMVINEDQLFRPGPQQDRTFELLEKLKRDGVRVDGLGNQAHFHSSFLPSPEDLLRVTDRFAAVVPKQVITEYDIVTNGDDALAADYLRDSLIACFSHPAYDGFLLWGFWEGAHWLPEAALWRKDWSIRPIGTVWEEWVGKTWHTRVELKSDATGMVTWRGFKGTYRLKLDGKETLPFQPGRGVVVRAP